MKVAVLLFGHLRDFKNCANSLKNHLLNKYDCDVFVHTWDETEPSTLSWHKGRTKNKAVGDDEVNIINGVYAPKKIEIEHQGKWADETIIESSFIKGHRFSTAGVHFMFYSMSKVNLLRQQYGKEHGINYDFVVVTRPDVQLKSYLDLHMIRDQARVLELDMEKCRFFASTPITMSYPTAFYINEPNDLLFLGTPQVINKYIDENLSIDDEFFTAHTINVVSNFTAKELKAGLIPIPLSYSLGVDWSFSRYRRQCFHFPFKKQVFVKTAIFLLRPVFILLKKHPELPHYNDCK